MGRGQSENVLYGAAATRNVGDPKRAQQRNAAHDLAGALNSDWQSVANVLIEHRELFLTDSAWSHDRLREIAATLPRDEQGLKNFAPLTLQLDEQDVANEIKELLEADVSAEELRQIELGVPSALLSLDRPIHSKGPYGATALLALRIKTWEGQCKQGGWDRRYTEDFRDRGLNLLLNAEKRGRAWNEAFELTVTDLAERHYEHLDETIEHLFDVINGFDLHAQYSPQGKVIHLTKEECGEVALCGRKLNPYSFQHADRGDWYGASQAALALGSASISVCKKCEKAAVASDHPSLTQLRSTPVMLGNQRMNEIYKEINDGLLRELKSDELNPENLREKVKEQLRVHLLLAARRELEKLPTKGRWPRLLGQRLHTDPEIQAYLQSNPMPALPNSLLDQVVERLSYSSSSTHSRSSATSDAADIFKVWTEIRDLDAEAKEFEEKRRNWKRWDRGRRTDVFKLSKEQHLFIDSGGKSFGKSITPKTACGASVSYDAGHRGIRYGAPKCKDCQWAEAGM